MTRALRTRWVLFGVLLLVAFTTLGIAVRVQPWGLDVLAAGAFHGEFARPLGWTAQILSDVLGPVLPVTLGITLLVFAAWSYRRGDRPRAWLLVRLTIVLTLCRLTSIVFKPLFERDRPRDYPDLSYPSGHVVSVASTAFVAVLVAVWLAPHLLRRAVLIAVAATVLAAACRIVLTVHWLTDTVGAVFAVGGVGLVAAVALKLLPAKPE
ncbi:phosphatase PAP2 family protein [Amycolatopsis suaedae]|uniref:Phosphatase PAP2 family protein n=1 Tax=Amycolatopsis suaedae TaxID=2510978 RepID=A0A4Q7IZC1_9PSEU|nr:phosphatase PAP2 family protein [Amycolatopsis suaedae]RZQ59433.1 phosphatase PAP2 family protein [Amycolatopsis suaedae]